MSLNESTLGTEIKAAVTLVFDIQDALKLEAFSNAVADAIINHFKTNGVIKVTVVGGSSSGVHNGVIE